MTKRRKDKVAFIDQLILEATPGTLKYATYRGMLLAFEWMTPANLVTEDWIKTVAQQTILTGGK